MTPQSAFKPFLSEDGTFRHLSSGEFANLSMTQKSEYLHLVSKELEKNLYKLREAVERRDKEFSPIRAPARNDGN